MLFHKYQLVVLVRPQLNKLRTAVWEADCWYYPFEGGSFPLEEWAANDAGKLHEGVKAVQEFCGQKFAGEFEQSLLPTAGR